MATPQSWAMVTSEELMDVQAMFDAHIHRDGVVDADEAEMQRRLVAAQDFVMAVHEDIVAYCHAIRVGKPSEWHERTRAHRDRVLRGMSE